MISLTGKVHTHKKRKGFSNAEVFPFFIRKYGFMNILRYG